ncbi:MAG: tRNA pseudouridine(38-40) synthase TruA [Proteobacteria bacterium]|nr:tRNA pseudouridine(38-40) synthase TruA [Pseudomonadota bacterium]MBU1710631.1 tRNA pseudouridine(38-40) synthase TruA [Pseudomonadota bacterium]
MNNHRQCSRFKLLLEYDGSRYSGWQKQNDARTIQGTLLDAGAVIFGSKLDIQGNGRTDAGVHALNYTAHLEASTTMRPEDILVRFNELLPSDIVVLEVAPCAARFHARHNCIGRSYLYRISLRKSAFAKKHVWWVKDKLDVKAMAEAGSLFVGMHDFVSFAEKQELKKSTKVMINAIQIFEDDEIIYFRTVGSHFLWKMIRRMAAVLVEVGRGKLSVEDVETFLRTRTDAPSRLLAPPAGLFFERAFYDQGEFNTFLSEIAEKA